MPMMLSPGAPRAALWSALQELLGIETSPMKAWGAGAEPDLEEEEDLEDYYPDFLEEEDSFF